MDYLLARYYSANQGRFTGVDPGNYQARLDLGDPQSWNAYSYVNNNPVTRVDPDGKGFFSKLKNWIVYDIWGEEEDVARQEAERRQILLNKQKENGGTLIIENLSGQLIEVDPANMSRLHVFFWSNRLMDIHEQGGGTRTLGPDEMVHVGASMTGSPALKGDPYHPDSVQQRVLPEYRRNPAHDPRSPQFNPRKTPEPPDAAGLYQTSVRGDFGTWYARGPNDQIYRYFSDNAGGVHFSGIVSKAEVPKAVLQQLGVK